MHAERSVWSGWSGWSVGSVGSVGSVRSVKEQGDGAEADAKGLPRRWGLDYKSSWSA
jgi:hypothetical protein